MLIVHICLCNITHEGLYQEQEIMNVHQTLLSRDEGASFPTGDINKRQENNRWTRYSTTT